MPYHGIDVHPDFQANIDWSRVNNHNTFAICKVSEGANWSRDTKNKARRSAVRKAGMIWGPYHFARPDGSRGDAEREADIAIWHARKSGWNLRVDLPLSLDIEATTLNSAATLAWCDRFARRVKAKTGRGCILYTGHWFWVGRLGLRRAPKYANILWFSAYAPRSKARQLWLQMRGFKPYIWQYTSSAQVAGYNGRVDRNVVLVDNSKFKALIHR